MTAKVINVVLHRAVIGLLPRFSRLIYIGEQECVTYEIYRFDGYF